MSRSLICIGLSLGLVGTLSTLAQAAQPAGATFESLDRNSDGKVSINEAADYDALFVAFKQLDVDKDGVLTREEFAVFQKKKTAA